MKDFPTFKQFLEARKNPELNPKISVYESLLPYKDDPDIYISFTKIDKLGINPSSKHLSTPLGIYAYPLKEIWMEYYIDSRKSFSSLPYAAKEKYISVLKCIDKSSFINDMYSDYSSTDVDKDKRILRQLYDSFNTTSVSFDEFVSISFSVSYIKNPIMAFWNLTKHLSLIVTGIVDLSSEDLVKELRDGVCTIQSITKWNNIIRMCGYTGMADKSGQEYIHANEPIQAVFFTTSAFSLIERIRNKDHKVKFFIDSFEDINAYLNVCTKSQFESLILFLKTGKQINPNYIIKKTNLQLLAEATFDEFLQFIERCVEYQQKFDVQGKVIYDRIQYIKKQFTRNKQFSPDQNKILSDAIEQIIT
jgi:hypothetical protein